MKLDKEQKQFIQAYTEAALFSSLGTPPGLDSPDGDNDIPLDEWDGPIALSTMKAFHKRCKAFYNAAQSTFEQAFDIKDGLDIAHTGHDFWMTHNHHGCGFWDGDWPAPMGRQLTKFSKQYESCDLYIGDDSRIYE